MANSSMPPNEHKTTGRPLWQAPALRALFHQCLAFLLTGFALAFLNLKFDVSVSPLGAALIQGILAAALSYWRRLAPWWLLIQLVFPIAAVALHGLQLTPVLFMVLFLVFLLLYWSTFRTQVPYYPSTKPVWRAVAQLLPADRSIRMIDIGSGFGGLVMQLAQLRPDCRFDGIELAPLPWLVSRLRARGRVRIMHGDYMALDFKTYDVVFAYLSPAAMPALWEKAHNEMRSGSLLLSYEFPIDARNPDLVVDPTSGGPALYGWRM